MPRQVARVAGTLCALLVACSLSIATASAKSSSPPADEMAQRQAVGEEVQDAMSRQDFKQVEALAARYRDPAERTSSGLWKLTVFYGAAREFLTELAECSGSTAAVDKYLTAWEVAIPQSRTLPLVRARYRLCVAQDALAAANGSPQAWATFANVTFSIQLDLERHKDFAATDPYWFETRLALAEANGAKDKDLEPVLAGLRAHRPAFYQGWFTAMDVLRRRDPGNAGPMIARLATRAADASRADEGDGMYARMWWYAFQVEYGDEGVATAPVDWPRMLRGIDDVLERYPAAWNLNNFARYTCLAGQRRKTAELMKRIGNHPMPQAWQSPRLFEACRDGRFGDTPTSAMR